MAHLAHNQRLLHHLWMWQHTCLLICLATSWTYENYHWLLILVVGSLKVSQMNYIRLFTKYDLEHLGCMLDRTANKKKKCMFATTSNQLEHTCKLRAGSHGVPSLKSQVPFMPTRPKKQAMFQLLSLKKSLKYCWLLLNSYLDSFSCKRVVLLDPILNIIPKPHLQKVFSCRHHVILGT